MLADTRPSISSCTSAYSYFFVRRARRPRISLPLIRSRRFNAESLTGCNGGMGDEAEQCSQGDEKPVLRIS
jgi:hypothetical protein